MPNLNNVVLGNTPAVLPDIAEQREIASTLDSIDRKIDLHRSKHTDLEELLRALLHNLMAGEVRLGS